MIYNFIKALRASNIRISAAETMEAIETLNHVGLFYRQLLKDSLSLGLGFYRGIIPLGLYPLLVFLGVGGNRSIGH